VFLVAAAVLAIALVPALTLGRAPDHEDATYAV